MENFSNFGSKYNDSYVVVVDGNNVVFSSFNKKPALRSAMRKVTCGHYVELWYQHGSGKCVLVAYWN